MNRCKLLLSAAFMLFSTSVFSQYSSPGTGVKMTLDDLVLSSGGVVTNTAGDYEVNQNLFISTNDTLQVDVDATVRFGSNTYLDVNGVLLIDPPTEVLFTAQNTATGFLGVRMDSSDHSVMRKLTMEYANSFRLFDCSPLFDGCIFRYLTPSTSFGNAAISLFRSNAVITNCQFLNNQRAAIQGGANIANAPVITGCYFEGNNTMNLNVPQINLGASGNDTTKIFNNQILRASTNSGGIGFLPLGNLNVVITGNTIKNNRYGVTLSGGSNINAMISYNQIDSNNTQGNPMLGGSGIAFSGGSATSQQNSIVTGNLIRWNLWGITIQNRSRPNLGNVNNADTSDDGKNQFIDNTNTTTPGIDVYNNSPDDIFAQNNYWGTVDPVQVEDRIYHNYDDVTLGTVDYSGFVLPLRLLSFNAEEKSGKIVLQWQTGSEANTNLFEVEKSRDGSNFYRIGTVWAKGNGSGYAYHDGEISSAPVFYRLKIVDKDASVSLSSVVIVRPGERGRNSVQVYPVCFREGEALTLDINLQQPQNIRVQWFDNAGKLLKSTQKTLNAGANAVTLQAPEVAPGVLFVRLAGQTLNRTIRVVKQ